MTVWEVVGTVSATVTLMSAIGGLALWMLRMWIRQQVEPMVTTIRDELRPNGGTSTRDAVQRVDQRTARIEDRLDRHIDNHSEK